MRNMFGIRFIFIVIFLSINVCSVQEVFARKVLCTPKGYDSYVSKEFDEVQKELVRLGWEYVPIGEDERITLQRLNGANAILFFEAYDFIQRNIDDLLSRKDIANAKKFFFCDDVHFFTDAFREKRLVSFRFVDIILATYPTQLLHFFSEISPDKVKWSPHSACSYFSPTFAPKTSTILLSGSRSWPYPFRQFCASMLPSEICTVVDHPGYPGYPGNKNISDQTDQCLMKQHGQEKYGELLRHYPAMFVDGSILNYLVAKVFEGMASGCLVLCDRDSLVPQLNRLGFREGEHFLATDLFHVKDDSRTFLDNLSENTGPWRSIVEAAYKKVASEHTTVARAKQIDIFVNNELNRVSAPEVLQHDFIRNISETF